MLKDVIKSARLECGFTQEEIARRVKVAKQTYLKWENGETEPKASQILLLAENLNITANEICSGIKYQRVELEDFIVRSAMANIPSELMTMYTWKMIPDHENFFNSIKNLKEDDYYGAIAEVGEIEKTFW